MKNEPKIKLFYNLLYKHYGPQGWWPAKSKTEGILGAILTQNTSWQNVIKALENLEKNRLINFNKINNTSTHKLAEIIKPSGFYNQKAKTIKRFINLLREYDMNLNIMEKENLTTLRKKLLKVKGIGPETADSILLYAFNKPSFVIDKYTHRIFARHRISGLDFDYGKLQNLVVMNFEEKTKSYNEYHALIVRLAKEHCRKKPDCTNCPLEFDLTKNQIPGNINF